MNQKVRQLPNRGHLTTEQRSPASAALDALSTEQAMRMMNTQDMDVPIGGQSDAIPVDLAPRSMTSSKACVTAGV